MGKNQEHKKRYYSLFILLLSVGILNLGSDLQGTLLGVRAGIEGMQEEEVGLFMSAFFAGFALGSLLIPHFLSRVGHIRTYASLASLVSTVSLLHAVFVSPYAWILFRAIHGAGYAGMLLVVESWLNSCVTSWSRGSILGIYGVVFIGSSALGQLLLNLAPPQSLVLFAVVSILISFSLIPLTLVPVENPRDISSAKLNLKKLMRISPVAVMGVFIEGISMNAFRGMGPTFAHRTGFSSAGVSGLMAITFVGALLLQWPLGRLSDRVDRRYVISGAAGVGAVFSLMIWVQHSTSLSFLMTALFFIGGFGIPLYSLCLAQANDYVRNSELVSTAEGMILIYGLGSSLGPFASSLVMKQAGPSGLFLFLGISLMFLALFGIIRLTLKEPISRELKKVFTVFPRSTHGAYHLQKQRKHGKEAEKIKKGKSGQ
jgi:MFS family permease